MRIPRILWFLTFIIPIQRILLKIVLRQILKMHRFFIQCGTSINVIILCPFIFTIRVPVPRKKVALLYPIIKSAKYVINYRTFRYLQKITSDVDLANSLENGTIPECGINRRDIWAKNNWRTNWLTKCEMYEKNKNKRRSK